ncbi:MAG TPA: hypothetical protein VHX38_10845 [Pseudonocardiaceae bacterium]|jgi:hypothetical protein|nr:hypothetical protein [Pseudonocardiaceae bacterium]
MLVRPDRQVMIAQAIICVLMLCGAAFGNFPSPVPILLTVGAVGVANAAFDLMRTFGSAVLGGVALASVALAPVPFVTCSAGRFTTVFDCTGNAPTWNLTGTVIAAGLSGASLVLARSVARGHDIDRLLRMERRLVELQRHFGILDETASDAPATAEAADEAIEDAGDQAADETAEGPPTNTAETARPSEASSG